MYQLPLTPPPPRPRTLFQSFPEYAGQNAYNVAWSPDGTKVAVAGHNFFKIVDVASWAAVKEQDFGVKGLAKGFAWSPLGETLAFAIDPQIPDADGKEVFGTAIHIVNVTTGEFRADVAICPYSSGDLAMAWNATGAKLAFGWERPKLDHGATLGIMDANTGKIARSVKLMTPKGKHSLLRHIQWVSQ